MCVCTIVTGDFSAQVGKRTNSVETVMGIFSLERGDTGIMGKIMKIRNHEYHVSEESREEVDLEKLKQFNENRDCPHPNKQARRRHRHNSHQSSQHWI